ncbi:hypothetical protein JCM13664_10790 [Methylothermus subterraneus]
MQVGAPAGSGDTGTYADYQLSLTNPTEQDTARTTGNVIYVAGVYQNQNVLKLGGKYSGGQDWSEVNSAYAPFTFNGKGAILLVAVPDGQTGTLTIQVDGGPSIGAFYTNPTLSGLFPNNHDPLKDQIADFLFFDIGDFAKNSNTVPDFASETGAADGQIKTITFSSNGFDWLHFDVLALETKEQGGGNHVQIVTTIENNPGSHDVTAFPPQVPPPPPQPAPEPGILWLLASGLLGMRFWLRKV